MNGSTRYLFTGILVTTLLAGCQSASQGPSRVYRAELNTPNRDPELARDRNARGIQSLHSGDLRAAESFFREALDADRTLAAAHNNLGKVQFEQGKYYEAAWSFEYASQLDPSQPEPRNNLALVFEHVGRFDDAVDHYGQALDLSPDNPEILGNWLRARVRRGDQKADLRYDLQRLLLLNPSPQWSTWATEQLSLTFEP